MDADWILILKMRQGNDAAWDQFIHKYYGDILQYCHFHCRDRDYTEDLTQEVFLRFFRSLSRYQHQGKAKNYLYTIAGNLCKNMACTKTEVPLEEIGECGAASELDDRLMLDSVIRGLPVELQEVVLLHYCQGLKQSEVAAVLKIGLPLVKYRLKRAKELLRKELEDGPISENA